MRLSPHLTFRGDCEEAFRFYERCLGGRELQLFRYAGTPMAAELPPTWGEKIVHASLSIGAESLAGADVAPETYEPPRGFFVLLSVAEFVTATRIFDALAEGGEVRMPLQRTFWSPGFGMLVDRFRIPWEVTCERAG